MTYENQNPDIAPSVEEQQDRLNKILAANMQTMINDREFFSHFMKRYEATHNRKPSPNDTSLSVSLSGFGRRAENGLWIEGEHLYVGVTSKFGDGSSTTALVPVAERINQTDGTKLVPQDGFTDEQAAMVAGMVDELTLAQVSGQIPNLHQLDLNHLYVPSDYADPMDRY